MGLRGQYHPPGLIDWCSPEFVVISGSRGDVSPEVTKAYASQGAEVFHTAIDGAVSITIDEGLITVTPFREVKAH